MRAIMSNPLTIYIDRLENGRVEKISQVLSPDFLDTQEKELSFPEKVSLEGEAYLTGEQLIIHLKIKTAALIPCSICNAPVTLPIAPPDFTHVEDLRDLRKPIFDLAPLVREAILLEIPSFAECNGKNCSERKNLMPYLKKSKSDHAHFPFENLDKK